jgi:hypothetical protein
VSWPTAYDVTLTYFWGNSRRTPSIHKIQAKSMHPRSHCGHAHPVRFPGYKNRCAMLFRFIQLLTWSPADQPGTPGKRKLLIRIKFILITFRNLPIFRYIHIVQIAGHHLQTCLQTVSAHARARETSILLCVYVSGIPVYWYAIHTMRGCIDCG